MRVSSFRSTIILLSILLGLSHGNLLVAEDNLLSPIQEFTHLSESANRRLYNCASSPSGWSYISGRYLKLRFRNGSIKTDCRTRTRGWLYWRGGPVCVGNYLILTQNLPPYQVACRVQRINIR